LGSNQRVTVNGILKTGDVPGPPDATISGGSYLQADPNAEMTIRTSRENDFLTIMTPIVANGTNAVTKTGAGTLTLSGVNTYTGGTYVTDGTLKIGASERLLNTGAFTVAGGTFDLQNFTETVGPVVLSTGAINGSGTGTLIGSSYDVRDGSASAILGGPASLTKNTEGTVTLTGANTYTGTTTVNEGQLVIAAPTGSALGSTTAITVNADGNLTLGANNQINDAAPVTLAGGTLSTGGFSEGTINTAGAGALNLTAAGSTIDFGTGDTGTLAFAIFNPGSNYLTIANWTGTPGAIGDGTTDQLLFAADPTPYLSSFNFSGYEPGGLALLLPTGFYEVTPDFTPVPEMNPTVAAALVCLFGLLAVKRSRRELGRLISRAGETTCSSFFARR
jgi:autotransporter-associated beta strand protein